MVEMEISVPKPDLIKSVTISRLRELESPSENANIVPVISISQIKKWAVSDNF